MTSEKNQPVEQFREELRGTSEREEEQETIEYPPQDDGFRMGLLLLLVMGLPLFLACLYFVLHAIFGR